MQRNEKKIPATEVDLDELFQGFQLKSTEKDVRLCQELDGLFLLIHTPTRKKATNVRIVSTIRGWA